MDGASPLDVIVVGGGIAGLTVSLCLQKFGFKCQVFEAKEDKQTSTSGINLSPTGVNVLSELGLLASIEEKAQAVRHLRMFNSEGYLFAELNLKGKEQGGCDYMAMTRRVLHNVLTDACKKRGIPIHYGSKLSGIEQDPDMVTAVFENSSQVQGRILIGADGIHSAVRGFLFPDLHLEKKDRAYYGCGMLLPLHYLTLEEQEQLRLAEGSMNMISGSLGFCGFIGIGTPDDSGEPKVMFWTHIAQANVEPGFDPKNLTQVKQVLQSLRGSWWGPVKKIIDLLDQALPEVEVVCAPIFSNPPIPTWSNSRAVLIGDAAHGYGPGAQGAALAMEDAMLLVRMMQRNTNFSGVFKEFEAKRRPRVERIGNEAEARNNGRLKDQGYFRSKLKEYVMMLYAWWNPNGPIDSYRVEDDLQ